MDADPSITYGLDTFPAPLNNLLVGLAIALFISWGIAASCTRMSVTELLISGLLTKRLLWLPGLGGVVHELDGYTRDHLRKAVGGASRARRSRAVSALELSMKAAFREPARLTVYVAPDDSSPAPGSASGVDADIAVAAPLPAPSPSHPSPAEPLAHDDHHETPAVGAGKAEGAGEGEGQEEGTERAAQAEVQDDGSHGAEHTYEQPPLIIELQLWEDVVIQAFWGVHASAIEALHARGTTGLSAFHAAGGVAAFLRACTVAMIDWDTAAVKGAPVVLGLGGTPPGHSYAPPQGETTHEDEEDGDDGLGSGSIDGGRAGGRERRPKAIEVQSTVGPTGHSESPTSPIGPQAESSHRRLLDSAGGVVGVGVGVGHAASAQDVLLQLRVAQNAENGATGAIPMAATSPPLPHFPLSTLLLHSDDAMGTGGLQVIQVTGQGQGGARDVEAANLEQMLAAGTPSPPAMLTRPRSVKLALGLPDMPPVDLLQDGAFLLALVVVPVRELGGVAAVEQGVAHKLPGAGKNSAVQGLVVLVQLQDPVWSGIPAAGLATPGATGGASPQGEGGQENGEVAPAAHAMPSIPSLSLTLKASTLAIMSGYSVTVGDVFDPSSSGAGAGGGAGAGWGTTTALPAEEGPSCVVCLSAPAGVLLLPCRHLAVCSACQSHLDACPVCRARCTGCMTVPEDVVTGAKGKERGSS